MSDTHALAVIPSNGVDTYRMSTDAANICGAIVKATAQKIQGKNYVKVEGWQAIAVAHGCAASARSVEVVDGGVRAIGEIRRMDTGAVIAEAEGFVGDDEKMWASRPMYARRAMAQTRAISRACRSAFAHVVVMIDASLSTTPAEEMDWGGNGDEMRAYPVDPDVAEANLRWVRDQQLALVNASTEEEVRAWSKREDKAVKKLFKDNEPLWKELKASYDDALQRVRAPIAA